MKPLFLAAVLAAAPQPAKPAAPSPAPAAAPVKAAPANPFLVERSGPGGRGAHLRPGRGRLSRGEKRVAWYLTLAAHAGEDIAYGQLGWKLVPAQAAARGRLPLRPGGSGRRERLRREAGSSYLLRFYGQTGNHDRGDEPEVRPDLHPGRAGGRGAAGPQGGRAPRREERGRAEVACSRSWGPRCSTRLSSPRSPRRRRRRARTSSPRPPTPPTGRA